MLEDLGAQLRRQRRSRGLTVEALATALGVTVARLLGQDQDERVIMRRRGDQPVNTDAAGWQRRILSPRLPGVEFELIRTTVPPRLTIGEFAAHAPGSREYAGDCVHAFANPGKVECVYYTAIHVAATHRCGEPH